MRLRRFLEQFNELPFLMKLPFYVGLLAMGTFGIMGIVRGLARWLNESFLSSLAFTLVVGAVLTIAYRYAVRTFITTSHRYMRYRRITFKGIPQARTRMTGRLARFECHVQNFTAHATANTRSDRPYEVSFTIVTGGCNGKRLEYSFRVDAQELGLLTLICCRKTQGGHGNAPADMLYHPTSGIVMLGEPTTGHAFLCESSFKKQ